MQIVCDEVSVGCAVSNIQMEVNSHVETEKLIHVLKSQ